MVDGLCEVVGNVDGSSVAFPVVVIVGRDVLGIVSLEST